MSKKSVCFSLALSLIFCGCSTMSKEEVFNSLKADIKTKSSGETVWIKTKEDAKAVNEAVSRLLSSPLTEESAIKIALLNNRSLQQEYEKIGVAVGDLRQAGLFTNPVFGYSIGKNMDMVKTTFSIEMAFLDLLWAPLRISLGELALEETKYAVGDAALKTLKEAKSAYIDAFVAEEIAKLKTEILKSAETSYQLAIRQQTNGSASKIELLKIKNAYIKARIESIEAAKESANARENLNKSLSLYSAQTNYSLGAKVEKPEKLDSSSALFETMAVQNRLDVSAAKKSVEYYAKQSGYAVAQSILSGGSLSGEIEREKGDKALHSVGVSIPIPIFDQGFIEGSRQKALYNQSVHKLYETAVNARSEARAAYASLKYATDKLEESQKAEETSQEILKETQLLYNGMLHDIYELLSDHREYAESKITKLKAYAEYKKALYNASYATASKIEKGGR